MKTLQECKETVAKNHGFSSWIRLYQQNTGLELKAMDEIAELYAQSRTEELQKEIERLKAEKEEYGRLCWDRACDEQQQICKDIINDEYRYDFKKPEFKP